MFLFVAIQSCKKEYQDVKRPYNEIKSFALAGYGELDSLHASVSGTEIVINWASASPLPAKIKPLITVSSGASIQPASGVEVELKNDASYTVTAEDGTARVYKIKINSLVAVPHLLSLTGTYLAWTDNLVANLTGEYFLANGDTSSIKVYLQRKKDGVELDMPLVKQFARQTTLRVNMPAYTNDCDTGWHKIWLKAGQQASQGIDVYLAQPLLRNAKSTFSFAEKGTSVAGGQTLTINYTLSDTYNGAITRYYTGKFNKVAFGIRKGTHITSLEPTNVKATNNTITFTISASDAVTYSGYDITQINAYAPRPVPTKWDNFDVNVIDLFGTSTKIK